MEKKNASDDLTISESDSVLSALEKLDQVRVCYNKINISEYLNNLTIYDDDDNIIKIVTPYKIYNDEYTVYHYNDLNINEPMVCYIPISYSKIFFARTVINLSMTETISLTVTDIGIGSNSNGLNYTCFKNNKLRLRFYDRRGIYKSLVIGSLIELYYIK